MKILGPRVQLRLRESNNMKGSLFLLEKDDGSQAVGEVIQIGQYYDKNTGKELPFPVKVGDFVIFPKYRANKIEEKDEEFYIINVAELIALVLSAENEWKVMITKTETIEQVGA